MTFAEISAKLHLLLLFGVLCPETESKDKMTMKSMTDRIKCDDVKAASAAFLRVLSYRSCCGMVVCPHASALRERSVI